MASKKFYFCYTVSIITFYVGSCIKCASFSNICRHLKDNRATNCEKLYLNLSGNTFSNWIKDGKFGIYIYMYIMGLTISIIDYKVMDAQDCGTGWACPFSYLFIYFCLLFSIRCHLKCVHCTSSVYAKLSHCQVKRTVTTSPSVAKLVAYKALVRLQMEYDACITEPHMHSGIDVIML